MGECASNSIILIIIIINMDIIPRRNTQQDKENVNNRNDAAQAPQDLQSSTKLPYVQLQKRNSLAQSFQKITLKQPEKAISKQESHSRIFVKLYRKELVEQSIRNGTMGPFLDRHYIDAGLRARMVDWMTEVTTSYRFESKTYFDSVQLLDQYLLKQKNPVAASDLHTLGVAAMLLSSKSNEVRPLRIHTAYEKIGHRKISINKLSLAEAQIMKVLQYKLNQWTFYDIATVILSPYQYAQLLPVLAYLCRVVVIQYEFYSKIEPQVLGEAVAWLALKVLGKPLRVDENVRQCGGEIINLLNNFKDSHTNLRNLLRFTERPVVQLVQQFLAAV